MSEVKKYLQQGLALGNLTMKVGARAVCFSGLNLGFESNNCILRESKSANIVKFLKQIVLIIAMVQTQKI